MMRLELISEFDPFLATHIEKYGNPGRGKTSYLSSTICHEFISLIASKVRRTIQEEIKQRKYYSLIVDSTPDVSHIDQHSLIIRYVLPNGVSVERFIQFIPKVGHKAEDMEKAVLNALTALGLDLRNCRGQSYDNASNMSGCYSGLQARICDPKTGNVLAIYIPCAAHTLNLVGTNSVESIFEIYKYFEYLQNLYTFLSRSTY